MTWQEQYQQPDGSAAELFERDVVPRITSLWDKDLVDRACVRIGDNVLDVACGTDVVTRLAAQTATPQARLLSKMMAQERDAVIQAVARDLASAMDSVGPTGEISSAQECNVLMAAR
jgi:hypothetical protein